MNDDLISRQDAIDTLMKRDKALRNINWYDKPYAEGECKGIDEALDIISALSPVQPEPQWIPCSERLPETEEQVLIYAWNVHYVLAKYKEIRTCDGVYKMAWVTEDAYNIPQEIKHEVICWMPLPEPYKENEYEEKNNKTN